ALCSGPPCASLLKRSQRCLTKLAQVQCKCSHPSESAAKLENLQRSCRFSNWVADDDASTCRFAEFSSKWRTRFSHLHCETHNPTVVQLRPRRAAFIRAKVKHRGRPPHLTMWLEAHPLRTRSPVAVLRAMSTYCVENARRPPECGRGR